MRWLRWIGFGGLVLIGLAAIVYWFYIYPTFWTANVKPAGTPHIVTIPTGSSYADVEQILEEASVLEQISTFRRCANQLKYPNLVKPGRYQLTPGWSNLQLVRHLRSGQQEPVRLTFHNVRLLDELAGVIARQIEPDSSSLLRVFDQQIPAILPHADQQADTALCFFLPNTYQVYWNTTPEGLIQRLDRDYQAFWTPTRRQQAQDLAMTPNQVYTLASIVEKETQVNPEKARIAGVYLNRLQRGIPLQADPTVVFAKRAFTARRVLKKDLAFDSPYNTYLYAGLPPGPICMPSLASLEAVLQAEEHDYLYFCARPDNSGAHNFARTLTAHLANARRFQRWLDQQGIYQ